MSLQGLLLDLLNRFQARDKATTLLLGYDEVKNWPQGILKALTEIGLIARASPAKSLICDGCEEACSMPVHTIPGSRPRAFIMCDTRNDTGRIPIAKEQLRQWQMSESAVVRLLLAATDEPSVTEPLIRDKLPALPLHKTLSFEQGQLRVDSNRLLHHLLPERLIPQPNRIALTGDHWTITFQGQTKTFNNTKGMRYIAYLIQNQSQEAWVMDLYYAINPPPTDLIDPIHSVMTADQFGEMGLTVGDVGDAGDTLTPEGKKLLEKTIRQIQEQIEEAAELGEVEKQAELEAEQKKILKYIAAESGMGGRTRKASSNIERLRKAVSKRISRDISKITTDFPDLGHHLKETLRTGTYCQYSPHPRVEWKFKA